MVLNHKTRKRRLKYAGAFLMQKGESNMADIKYERESDAPADWKTDTILQRDASGEVFELKVPDDDSYGTEVNKDAGDD